MNSDPQPDDRALKEAWRWLKRLENRAISSEAVQEFFDWRSDPGNDAAYRQAERIHRQSGAQARSPFANRPFSVITPQASGRKPKARSASLTRLVLGPASMALLALAFFAVSMTPREQTFETAVGERKVVTLADGTLVSLDTGTKLHAQVSKHARVVSLIQGQALFNVAHKLNLPFKVVAAGTTVTDLGTRFDVRKDADVVRVTVLSGSAEVATAGTTSPAWILHSGQQVSTEKPTDLPHAVDAAAATSWVVGRLLFEDTPLSLAVAEVNRYARKKVMLAGHGLDALRFSGTFAAGDTQGFVADASKRLDLAVELTADGAITLSRADTSHGP